MNRYYIYNIITIITLGTLMLTACIHVPDELVTVSQRTDEKIIQNIYNCDGVLFEKLPLLIDLEIPELNSEGFVFLNWNIQKSKKNGWEKDFEKLIQKIDVLTLQEASLNTNLRSLLKKEQYQWDLSRAFLYRGEEVGVLTASRAEPQFMCTFRIKEPLIQLPKTIMVITYPLSGTDERLLVINIHAINITFQTKEFNAQLSKIEEILPFHHGPVIVSGDFNTWSRKRTGIVKDIFKRYGLKALTFEKDFRTRKFGHEIDHIYYRGLMALSSKVVEVSSSDHNPIIATFRFQKIG